MVTQNKYEDISVLDALNYIKSGKILLPDIQREYVWNYHDIELLFESVVEGYPIGSCIMWKTTRIAINENKPNLYYFHTNFSRKEPENKKVPEVLAEDKENDYYIVLDGQQRLTSFNIAFNGSYTDFKGGKGNPRDNPENWITRELYYNLQYDPKADKDDETPSKRFAFLKNADGEQEQWYKVKQLLKYDKQNALIKDLLSKGYSEQAQEDLTVLFERIHAVKDGGLIHYYSIEDEEYDHVLDIFVRVNSTGQKLAKSDLLFSTLIDGWKIARDDIEKFLKTLNSRGEGFAFNKDFLMRLCMALVDGTIKLKIQNLNRKTISKIRDNWEKIKNATSSMVDLLVDLGFSSENLTSYNATMPIVYFLFKGGNIKDDCSHQEVKKFLAISMAKRLFGVSSDAALTKSREVLQNIDCSKTKFSISLFSSVVLVGGRTFTVSEDDVDYWLDNYQKGPDTYSLLSLLYPNCKLSYFAFHQDHCHPYTAFENKNLKKLNLKLTQEKISEWQKKRNLLPNLQFLEGTENESKNSTPFKEWVSAGNDFDYRPENVSLELVNFDNFFKERRKLMKARLLQIFNLEPSQNPIENNSECNFQQDNNHGDQLEVGLDSLSVESHAIEERINILSKKFIEQKELLGKVRIGKCDDEYIRFTTDLMDGIIPESEDPTSGWETNKYYYYEISYEDSKIVMCLTFSKHLTPDLLETCKKIHSIFPCIEEGRIQKHNNWKHTLLVTNEEDTTDTDSDECINGILEKLFDRLMKLERQLVDELNARV